ncbi:MAG: TerC family protein [Bacteroidetes bacterium]|nr:TerC family protein [Bacteroidota bacterium]
MIVLWVGFIVFIIMLLALDLGVFNKRAHVIGVKEAIYWSIFWISLALLFIPVIYLIYGDHLMGAGLSLGSELNGHQAAVQYLTGYLIEKTLSLDNIFVIAIIFNYFNVPAMYQHRVLFWGILGAILLRGIMIGAGAILIAKFFWMNYAFGALLIFTAIKMLKSSDHKIEPNKNPLVKLARKIYPVTNDYHEQHFFIKENHKKYATPLFIALLVVEGSDVMFAVDSIPAIFAITKDPFIVFSSNIFAILGLRSLYFALAAMIDKFVYLKYSLFVILFYVGIKMIVVHHFEISAMVSLVIILFILVAGVVASMYKSESKTS